MADEATESKPKRGRRPKGEGGEPDYSAILDKLTLKALREWEKILSAKVERSNRGYVRSLTIKERAANNVVRAAIALGAQKLKRQQKDKIGELLALVKKEQALLGRNSPPVLDQVAREVDVLEEDEDEI